MLIDSETTEAVELRGGDNKNKREDGLRESNNEENHTEKAEINEKSEEVDTTIIPKN